MIFNIENYKRALEFAARAHGEQKTPTGLPYLFHITSVASEVINANLEDNYDVAITCALLHDTIEDTKITYEDIKVEFGEIVANGVFALTKDKRLDSKEEQMANSLLKLKKESKEIQAVKLADRITNLSSVPEKWDFKKKDAYLKESIVIYNSLKESNEFLASRLLQKITEYSFKF